MNKILYKSNSDKVICGVCGGIASYFGFNSNILRVLFIVFIGVMFWVYVALVFLMPTNDSL
ncbi:PspC domain-containing protein [Clostridium sp. Sa3CUN1]|uniref:PspC domain-containing protein n=1 Tax=Clostridium gallinarum TaxID=2762246 RepID=A0ABR8Q7S4_9CLOT|nr:PspC domain-containing protein [Clostridium gallinarum]MBD7916425.1 PspC domain-containing protein [Clostridium gallinarum]